MIINVATHFSAYPGGRTKVMGPASGEEFREFLVRELNKEPSQIAEVELDGAEGYGSSFLEEAFGGLIRDRLLPPDEALRRIKIIARTPAYESYAREARAYMEQAAKRAAA